jgi:hypothetical protein
MSLNEYNEVESPLCYRVKNEPALFLEVHPDIYRKKIDKEQIHLYYKGSSDGTKDYKDETNPYRLNTSENSYISDNTGTYFDVNAYYLRDDPGQSKEYIHSFNKFGIQNKGNSCHFNAAFQMLYHTYYFRNYLVLFRSITDAATEKQYVEKLLQKKSYMLEDEYQILVFYLIKLTQDMTKNANEFYRILTRLIKIIYTKEDKKQQDSQNTLLNLNSSLLYYNSCEVIEKNTRKKDSIKTIEIQLKKEDTNKDISGKIRELQKTNTYTLYNTKLPFYTLMLQVSRFISDDKGGIKRSGASISNYDTFELDRSTFYLKGIILHSGPSPNSGHYRYLHKKRENTYILFDDLSVEEIDTKSANKLISSEGYILQYVNTNYDEYEIGEDVVYKGQGYKVNEIKYFHTGVVLQQSNTGSDGSAGPLEVMRPIEEVFEYNTRTKEYIPLTLEKIGELKEGTSQLYINPTPSEPPSRIVVYMYKSNTQYSTLLQISNIREPQWIFSRQVELSVPSRGGSIDTGKRKTRRLTKH